MSPPVVGFGLVVHLLPTLTAIEREGTEAAKWDLEGRPVSGVFDGRYCRRGISNEMTARGKIERAGTRLGPAEKGAVLARFALLAADARRTLAEVAPEPARSALAERLDRILAGDAARLERDAARFRSIYRPVPVLPPDRTLAFVVQLTEGCSWNRCSFCGLYPDREFRVKDAAELESHVREALALFGRSVLLRRSVYVGDGDPFVLPDAELLPLVDRLLALFREEEAKGTPLPSPRDLYAFARLRSLRARSGASLRAYRERGFRRLYIGVETGDPELYRLLRKPGRLEDLPAVIAGLREAFLSVGLIFLVGVGGDRFRASHAEATARLVSSLPLDETDLVYLSPFRTVAGSAYERWAEEEAIRPLDRSAIGAEARSIVRAIRRLGSRAKTAYYPLENFVY